MKAIILAAGYATRLRPLTDTWAKELLPVGGRPIIDHILQAIRAVDSVDGVHVVTNASKAAAFESWAAGKDVLVHDDGTSTNEDRLGAIGDLEFVIERAGIDDDLLVVAGDNLFDFDLRNLAAYRAGHGAASAVAVRDVGSTELARRYGIVELDVDDRMVDFVEKPEEPRSTLAATATYVFDRAHVPLVGAYLAEGNLPDQPGLFVGWLQARRPVYGWRFSEAWYDIGDLEQLLIADNRARAAVGLAPREAYSPG